MDVRRCKATAPETGAWSDVKLAPKVKGTHTESLLVFYQELPYNPE